MRKLFTFFALAVMAFAAQAIVPSDISIVLLGQEGKVVQYTLYPAAHDANIYVTMVTLEPNDWGASDDEEQTNVSFYFIVNGQRVGAEVDMTPIVFVNRLNEPLEYPLFATDFCYTVPVGYVYTLGIQFADDGNMYVFAYQEPPHFHSIDELNANKAVASVRYYNMAGQEMQQAEGPTIVVTTYTDGTTSAVKVVK